MPRDDFETLEKRTRIASTLESWDYTLIHAISADETPVEVRDWLLSMLVNEPIGNSTVPASPGSSSGRPPNDR
jgi:hypothetical protein